MLLKKNPLVFNIFSVLICTWVGSFQLSAQSNADSIMEKRFERAQNFVWDSINKKTYNLEVKPQLFGDNSGFAYRIKTRNGFEYFSVDFKELKKQKSFDQKKLADVLSELTEEEINHKKLPIRIIHWRNKDEFNFVFKNSRYGINLKSYKISPLKDYYKRRDKSISVSPDKKYEVYIEEDNLYLKNRNTNTVKALSTDGEKDYIYGSAYGWSQTMKGENAYPEPRLKVKWSPDSKKILTQITDMREADKMYMLDWSQDSLYRAELVSYFRPSPGDMNFVKLYPVVFDVESLEMTKLNLDPQPHRLDFGRDLSWSSNSKMIYGTYDHRGFKKKDFIEVNPNTGKTRIVYTEESETNIDYHTRFRFVRDKNLAFLTSEKTGWKQLYVLDWDSGKLKQLTKGEFVVNDIKSIDVDNEKVYFTAMGRETDVNPYYKMLYKIDFDGNNLRLLTPEAVNHKVYISPDRNYFLDNLSTAKQPNYTLLRSTEEGEVLMRIEQADIEDLQKMGWDFPQLFTAIAQDGKTELYGALWKPTDFDPDKKYPLIEYVYTGPHTNVFPNTFSKGVYGLYNSNQALAELGFVVMQVDGMGTAGRSKAFQDVSYKNMGDNLIDHELAIKQLGRKYNWIDTTRVGIYGHSAGGYDAAHALIAFNETYKVAVSSAGDHDWRMEKAWWPELYVGWPVDEYYHNHSNITLANKLKGNLLLIHGALDENVNVSATIKLSEALIKAGKYFDLLIVPSARHAYPKKYYPYIQQKRWRFFVDHLIEHPQVK
ncbi:MAG TPA: DPP IV N-terminal domain-containing protein [Flavobacteriaceae bacterium]|nr:DPP IV N-terminal domain-containing protein [Flavobacteriaceae bacterium]